MSLFSVWALVAIFSQVALSSQQVTLTSPENNVTERGHSGPSGKRGPKGDPGMRGEQGIKGDRGQSDDSREMIDRLQQKLVELENKVNQKQAMSNHTNCDDLYQAGFSIDGFYSIVVNEKMLEVYCEFQRDGINWMIFQRRFSGEVDFYRNWNDYVEGFGQKYGEFWLGLKHLYSILSTGRYLLRVDIEDWEGNKAYAEYRTFLIGDEFTNYRATFQDYSGNAGSSLSYHDRQRFSTKDFDNDDQFNQCADTHFGGWWYRSCHHANLNGKFLKHGVIDSRGMTWYHWKNRHYSLKKSEMKIRPVTRPVTQ